MILATSLLLTLPQSRRETPAEMPRSQVSQRDGSWYRQGETTPFTGVMVETYETGGRKSRSEIAEGRLEAGLRAGTPTVNPALGVFSCRGFPRTANKMAPEWPKLSEVQLVQGKLEGTFRRWYEDGSLYEEIQLVNGKPEGVSRAFYPAVFLRAEARLHNGNCSVSNSGKTGNRASPHLPQSPSSEV